MNINIVRGTALVTFITMLAGCASMSSYEREALCVATGAAIGGGAGATQQGDDAIKGAIGGALIGALVCHFLDGDSDQDGVPDSRDKCPGTPLGVKVDSDGCPIEELTVAPVPADEDLDGIVDADDLCPGTPEGVAVDSKGCPPVQDIVLDGVTFEFDSAILTADANKVLLKQVEVLKANPAVKLSITGHTDNSGAEKYNQILSLERAQAVRDFFVEQGIDGSIVTVSGAGEMEPVADNASREGRAVNRRVELQVVREES